MWLFFLFLHINHTTIVTVKKIGDIERKNMKQTTRLVKELLEYAKSYREPPYGMEVDGTPELLEKTADTLAKISNKNKMLEKKFVIGMEVEYKGDDESDNIKCPMCKDVVAWNDDYQDMRPKHCPNCGTKLIY